jgi:hypothetical protein
VTRSSVKAIPEGLHTITPHIVVRDAAQAADPAAYQPGAQAGAGPGAGDIVGLWPVKTLAQARELQDSVDAGHQPWLLSPEQVSIAYATG